MKETMRTEQGAHTHDIEHEADESVVRGKGQENLVNQDNVLEVINDTLAVQKVHGGAQKVPIERLGQAQFTGPAGDI